MKAQTLLILGLLFTSTLCLVCPNTRLEFFSHFSLGRQDQLNRTFTAISKNITIPEVVYNYSETARYRVGDYNLTYRYLDTNQKSNATGHDTVIVYGGRLRVDVAFNWNVSGTVNKSGTGAANAISDQIMFAKNILVNNQTGFIMWNLVDHQTISFDENKFVITRFNPADQKDQDAVTKMLNHMVNGSGFKDYLMEGVNTVMDFHLNNSLHEEHFQEEKFTNYTFRHPTKGNFTVQYQQDVTMINIGPSGLHLLTSLVIKNYPDHNCGKMVPNDPLDVNVYGGLQTFISLGFVESNVRWALANNIFNTDLNEQNWESWHFQFYAGDLYDVIPALQKKMYPNQPLNGKCEAQKNNFSLKRGSIDTLNVTMSFKCFLNANTSGKILDFDIDGLFVVKGRPQQHHLDFVVNHTELNATYYQTGQYVVVNKQLADYYLYSTSWALWNTKVFGSNFSIISRDYPHFEVSKDEYIIIYDSSHVGNQQVSEQTK